MDPKMIEMNNLRVLNDYLNQTIDALSRQSRLGQPTHLGLGFSPFAASPFGAQQFAASPFGGSQFAPIPTTAAGFGTDTVYNPWFGPSMYGQTPFAATSPFTPVYGTYGAVDPYFAQLGQLAQRGIAQTSFGGWQQPWTSAPIAEVSRQAQLSQALAARQSVLEAACRACGIPV